MGISSERPNRIFTEPNRYRIYRSDSTYSNDSINSTDSAESTKFTEPTDSCRFLPILGRFLPIR